MKRDSRLVNCGPWDEVSNDNLNEGDLEDLFFGRFNPLSLQRFDE